MSARIKDGQHSVILNLKEIRTTRHCEATLSIHERTLSTFNFSKLCMRVYIIVSAARSLTCRDDLNSKWRLLLAEKELSRVSLLSRISIGN